MTKVIVFKLVLLALWIAFLFLRCVSIIGGVPMISAWWLLLIVPLSASFGIVLAALMAANK